MLAESNGVASSGRVPCAAIVFVIWGGKWHIVFKIELTMFLSTANASPFIFVNAIDLKC